MLDPFANHHPVRDLDGHITDFEYATPILAMAENVHVDCEALTGRRLLDVRQAHRSSGLFEMYCHAFDSGEPLALDGWFYEDKWGGEVKAAVVRTFRAQRALEGPHSLLPGVT